MQNNKKYPYIPIYITYFYNTFRCKVVYKYYKQIIYYIDSTFMKQCLQSNSSRNRPKIVRKVQR